MEVEMSKNHIPKRRRIRSLNPEGPITLLVSRTAAFRETDMSSLETAAENDTKPPHSDDADTI